MIADAATIACTPVPLPGRRRESAMTGRSVVASGVAGVLGPVSARRGCVRWCFASALASFRAGRLAMPCARCLSEISACFSSSISAPHGSPPSASSAALQACLSRRFAQRCGVPQAPERRTLLSFPPRRYAFDGARCVRMRLPQLVSPRGLLDAPQLPPLRVDDPGLPYVALACLLVVTAGSRL